MPRCRSPNKRAVWLAVLVALGLRLFLFFTGDIAPASTLERSYVEQMIVLASGHGFIMPTALGREKRDDSAPRISALEFIKQRQAAGGWVDRNHPYPKDTAGWIPATLHPAGYSCLLYVLYQIGNYDGMILSAHLLQIGVDALVCLLIFLFARNVFDRRVAVVAAWCYACCPPAWFLCQLLMPDAYHGFFTALILCLASYARPGRNWFLLLAGTAIGLACHFRSEYIMLPVALYMIVLLNHGRFWRSTLWSASMIVAMLAVISPWGLWSRSVVGKMLWTSTGGGATLYVSLGDEPQNPWGIVCNDTWIARDAIERGMDSPYSVEANQFYRSLFFQSLKEHPGCYAQQVIVHRLPLALVTPHLTGPRSTNEEFNFSRYLREEGLSRWGVLRKYPGRVLRYMWPQLVMLAISAVLTFSLIAVLVIHRHHWRQYTWLLLPWVYTVGTMSLVKAHEPRNIAPVLVVQVVALAIIALTLLRRFGWTADWAIIGTATSDRT